ncbi:MAG: winged helix-turn-helix domain-containing protein [Gammaproteobacteria bacterium]
MHEVFRLGAFDFDATVLRLYRGGTSVDIEPRPLEVLAELVREAGQVVTKSDLLEKVWANRVVTESVLTRCINQLRIALDDEARTLVLTVHGYGYRFTGEVQRLDHLPVEFTSHATVWLPEVDGVLPGRLQWQLVRALDVRASVWLTRHRKTGERRALKFALDAARLGALKRELTIHRTLQRLLPERDDYARLLDCSFESPPFFVELEYCELGSLGEWLAGQGGVDALPLEARLELLAQAADGLAAAHAVGVLHLDVKPNNLLVRLDDDGRPRLRWTDFGSGRLLEPERLAQLDITRQGLTDGSNTADRGTTPLYVAPEVLAGQQPGAPADIYALGVMLFQLVVGDLRRPMAPGWEHDVDDELLREDIAAAAHGSQSRRLTSAAEFAARIRGLSTRRKARGAQRAIIERAAALQSQVERSKTRRPWVVAAGFILVAGMATSLYQYRQAVEARDAAREQTEIAEAVTQFFNQDILGAASAYQIDYRGELTVREAVERAAARLDGGFLGRPLAEAAIRERLAALFLQSADLPRAAHQLERTALLYAEANAAESVQSLGAQYLLAGVLIFSSRFEEAERRMDRLDAAIENTPDFDRALASHRDALRATLYRQQEQYEAVVPYSERLLTATMGRTHDAMELALRRYTLGLDFARVGRFTESHEQFALVFDLLARSGDTSGAFTGLARSAFGTALLVEGRNEEAKAVLADAYTTLAAAHGPRSESAAEAQMQLCRALTAVGDLLQAAVNCREAHGAFLERFGPDSHFTAVAARYLAGTQRVTAGPP